MIAMDEIIRNVSVEIKKLERYQKRYDELEEEICSVRDSLEGEQKNSQRLQDELSRAYDVLEQERTHVKELEQRLKESSSSNNIIKNIGLLKEYDNQVRELKNELSRRPSLTKIKTHDKNVQTEFETPGDVIVSSNDVGVNIPKHISYEDLPGDVELSLWEDQGKSYALAPKGDCNYVFGLDDDGVVTECVGYLDGKELKFF